MKETLAKKLEQASLSDPQFVTAEGKSCQDGIDGVRIRDLIVHTDERGTVCEMLDPRWGWHPDPIQTAYYYTIRPGYVKGWAVHKLHEDRYCLVQGEMKVVLYDTREDSPSFKKLRVLFLSEQRRQLLSIPVGVWHADQAIGNKDVLVVNFPTVPYNHQKPDKYRLPVDTDLIPYDFQGAPGG